MHKKHNLHCISVQYFKFKAGYQIFADDMFGEKIAEESVIVWFDWLNLLVLEQYLL